MQVNMSIIHFPGAIKVEVKRPFKFLILLNPHSSKGHAHALFYGNVQPVPAPGHSTWGGLYDSRIKWLKSTFRLLEGSA